MSNKRALPNEKQLTPQLAGLSTGMVSMAAGVSASRGQMEGGQASQVLVLNEPTYPRTYTGVEQEMAKYTFAARAQDDCDVYRLIDKRILNNVRGNPLGNPMTLVVVKRDSRDAFFDIIEVPTYFSYHNNFGFMTKKTDKFSEIRRNRRILSKGDVLCDTPSNGPEGFYRRGILTKASFLTYAPTAEDGYWVSSEWCEEAKSTAIGEITINIPLGSRLSPIYGTKDNPKYIPDIGEDIRPDGLVLATRERDDILDCYSMSSKNQSKLDYTFDNPRYIESSARNGKVIDIDVVVNESNYAQSQLVLLDSDGEEVEDQILRLWEERKRYSKEVIDTYIQIEREFDEPQFSGAFNQEIVRAMYIAKYLYPKKKTKFEYHGQDVPIAMIRIKYKYDIIPNIGSKLSGDFGDKGVICRITPRSHMPKDQYGNVCDIVVHANATINRMISVRLDDNYLGAQCLLIEKKVRDLNAKGQWREAFDVLAEFYSIATPRHYKEKFIPFMTNDERKRNHVECVVKYHIMLNIKHNDTPNHIALTDALEKHYPYKKNRLAYIRTNGKPGLTKTKAIIGTSYYRVLDKTPAEWGAVDSATRQAHGMAAKASIRDKNTLPYRKQPYRYGESEIRPLVALCGAEFVSDLMDRSNNAVSSEEVLRNILYHDRPSDMVSVIDRKKFPIGRSSNLTFWNNAIYSSGAVFVRSDDNSDDNSDDESEE